MNPGIQQNVGPEIMAALMRRRAMGVGGGNTAPAQQQVMAPNPMGGPLGASATPLATPPQAMPAGSVQQAQPSMQGQAAGQSPQAQGTSTGGKADPTKALMKALLQNLIADH